MKKFIDSLFDDKECISNNGFIFMLFCVVFCGFLSALLCFIKNYIYKEV